MVIEIVIVILSIPDHETLLMLSALSLLWNLLKLSCWPLKMIDKICESVLSSASVSYSV